MAKKKFDLDNAKAWFFDIFLAAIWGKIFSSKTGDDSSKSPGEIAASVLAEAIFPGENGIEGYTVLVNGLSVEDREALNTYYDGLDRKGKEKFETALNRHVDAISDGVMGIRYFKQWIKDGPENQWGKVWPRGQKPQTVFLKFWKRTISEGVEAINRAVEVFTSEPRYVLAWNVLTNWITGTHPRMGAFRSRGMAAMKHVFGWMADAMSMFWWIFRWSSVFTFVFFGLATIANLFGLPSIAALFADLSTIAAVVAFAVFGLAAAIVLRALGHKNTSGNYVGIVALGSIIPILVVMFMMATPEWGVYTIPWLLMSGFAGSILLVWNALKKGQTLRETPQSAIFDGVLSFLSLVLALVFIGSITLAFIPKNTWEVFRTSSKDSVHVRAQRFRPDGSGTDRQCFNDPRTNSVVELISPLLDQVVDTETNAKLRECSTEDVVALRKQARKGVANNPEVDPEDEEVVVSQQVQNTAPVRRSNPWVRRGGGVYTKDIYVPPNQLSQLFEFRTGVSTESQILSPDCVKIQINGTWLQELDCPDKYLALPKFESIRFKALEGGVTVRLTQAPL